MKGRKNKGRYKTGRGEGVICRHRQCVKESSEFEFRIWYKSLNQCNKRNVYGCARQTATSNWLDGGVADNSIKKTSDDMKMMWYAWSGQSQLYLIV